MRFKVQFPWRRERLCTPVFLPEKSHGQWSLAGYSPWGHKETDTTEHAHTQLAYEYECGPIDSDNWTFTGLFLRTSSSLSKPSSPCRCFRNALGLFMFVHNRVYSGHFFHHFMCSWGKAVPNQWSQFLCWARFHGSWWYLDGATVSQMPQKGPESPWSQSSCDYDMLQSCLKVGMEVKWALSSLFHSFGSSILQFSISRLIFIYNPLPSYLRVSRSLESDTGWSNVPHWGLHIPLRTEVKIMVPGSLWL